jgi:hypothetical protein
VQNSDNTGQLLVSAVADEKNGIAGSVAALKAWLTDGNRFSTEWIRAVEEDPCEGGQASFWLDLAARSRETEVTL